MQLRLDVDELEATAASELGEAERLWAKVEEKERKERKLEARLAALREEVRAGASRVECVGMLGGRATQ